MDRCSICLENIIFLCLRGKEYCEECFDQKVSRGEIKIEREEDEIKIYAT